TLPVTRLGASEGGNQTPVSSTYRQRGLITPEDPTTIPSRRTPTIDSRAQIENHTRPSIQEMVNRRPQSADAASTGVARGHAWEGATTVRGSSYATQSRPRDPSAGSGESRGYQAPRAEPRTYAPPAETHPQAPRVQAPLQVESRPVVRDAPVSRPTPP